MKIIVSASLIIASLGCSFGYATATPATNDRSTASIPLRRLLAEPGAESRFRRGTTPTAIETAFGAPDLILDRQVWIYWNMASSDPRSTAEGFDTLLVQFSDDGLRLAKLIRGADLRALIARQNRLRVASQGD